MLHKNSARYFLPVRHVFTNTSTLLSDKSKTCKDKFDFLSLPDLDGGLSVIYVFASF